MNIFIVDDDLEFSEVVAGMLVHVAGESSLQVRYFTNAIEAINATSEEVPDLIFLDVLLDGPDGFTLLNEMQSYEDLAKVPVVLMTSLEFAEQDLSRYGVVAILNKSEMVPEQLSEIIEWRRRQGHD